MAVRLNVSNNGQTTLVNAITASQTSIQVVDVSTFPAAPFIITIDAEFMEVSAVDAVQKLFTVIRAREGSTAATHTAGTFVENRWTAGTYGELVAAINQARQYAP